MNSTALVIALILMDGPTWGYNIWQKGQKELGINIPHGSLYRTLQRMENDGLVTSAPYEGQSTNRSKEYRLTPKGEELIRAEINEMDNIVQWAREQFGE